MTLMTHQSVSHPGHVYNKCKLMKTLSKTPTRDDVELSFNEYFPRHYLSNFLCEEHGCSINIKSKNESPLNTPKKDLLIFF